MILFAYSTIGLGNVSEMPMFLTTTLYGFGYT